MFSERAVSALRAARSVAVLTGAGVSAESGVPTFRGPGGLWRTYRAADLATPEAFARDPKLVWEFYNWRREVLSPLTPNPGHRALAALERRLPRFTLITQNIDSLHREAGSENILELHGNIWRMRCLSEGTAIEQRQVPLDPLPPRCACGALLRPDVVWFGESLEEGVLRRAFQAASESDFFLVAGTSAVVQPAASLPLLAKEGGAFVLEVNAEETPVSGSVAESVLGPSGELLPRLAEAAFGGDDG